MEWTATEAALVFKQENYMLWSYALYLIPVGLVSFAIHNLRKQSMLTAAAWLSLGLAFALLPEIILSTHSGYVVEITDDAVSISDDAASEPFSFSLGEVRAIAQVEERQRDSQDRPETFFVFYLLRNAGTFVELYRTSSQENANRVQDALEDRTGLSTLVNAREQLRAAGSGSTAAMRTLDPQICREIYLQEITVRALDAGCAFGWQRDLGLVPVAAMLLSIGVALLGIARGTKHGWDALAWAPTAFAGLLFLLFLYSMITELGATQVLEVSERTATGYTESPLLGRLNEMQIARKDVKTVFVPIGPGASSLGLYANQIDEGSPVSTAVSLALGNHVTLHMEGVPVVDRLLLAEALVQPVQW